MFGLDNDFGPRPLTSKKLWRRCLFLLVGMMFFALLAAARARTGEYGFPDRDEWAFTEEDEDNVMSADDMRLAQRLQRRAAAKPVYSKAKARRIHDSVTITIKESTTGELKSKMDLKRTTDNNMKLTSWLTPSFKGGKLGTTQHGTAAAGDSTDNPTVAYNNSRNHKTDSKADRSQTFNSVLTGEVIEVLPNGHLVVEARKRVEINGETQTLLVTGIVNPNHMNSESEVDANRVMDMSVRYSGNGPMTRMDKRGWAAQIMDFVTPF